LEKDQAVLAVLDQEALLRAAAAAVLEAQMELPLIAAVKQAARMVVV